MTAARFACRRSNNPFVKLFPGITAIKLSQDIRYSRTTVRATVIHRERADKAMGNIFEIARYFQERAAEPPSMIVPVHSIRIPLRSHKSPRVPRHTCWIYRRFRWNRRSQKHNEHRGGRWICSGAETRLSARSLIFAGNCLEGSSKVDRTSNIRRWIRIRLRPSLFEFHSNELASWMLAIWNIKLERVSRALCKCCLFSHLHQDNVPVTWYGACEFANLVWLFFRRTITVLIVRW